jgi:hypothetical protein
MREQLLVLDSSDLSTAKPTPTGLIGCDRDDSLREKVHGKSNLCVLIEGN